MLNYALNNKEYDELNKYHNEFDKTIFGKKVKMLIGAEVTFGMVFLLLGIICLICSVFINEELYVYAAISGGIFFTITILSISSQIQYENMVMNYIKEKNNIKNQKIKDTDN